MIFQRCQGERVNTILVLIGALRGVQQKSGWGHIIRETMVLKFSVRSKAIRHILFSNCLLKFYALFMSMGSLTLLNEVVPIF